MPTVQPLSLAPRSPAVPVGLLARRRGRGEKGVGSGGQSAPADGDLSRSPGRESWAYSSQESQGRSLGRAWKLPSFLPSFLRPLLSDLSQKLLPPLFSLNDCVFQLLPLTGIPG